MTDPAIEIPDSHWEDTVRFKHFVPGWTEQLRASIRNQPDAAQRFEEWLSKLGSGAGRNKSARLMFIEQPYLTWAVLVQQAINVACAELRQEIADEIADPSSR